MLDDRYWIIELGQFKHRASRIGLRRPFSLGLRFFKQNHHHWESEYLRLFNTVCLLTILAAITPGLTASAAEDPNFIVFLTDDQGWGDLACYGHPIIKSPNLDAFAEQSVRFTQCYAACGVCSPSRSAILTGRTPYRNGVWRWIPSRHPVHLRTSEITIAELLKERGYSTCHAGKWHLNGYFNDKRHPQPSDHGYDHWLATQNNAAPNHMNPTNYVRNGKPVGRMEGPSAVLAATEAINWLKSRKDQSQPFFITVWTHEPHLPIESAPEFMEPYKDIQDEGIRQHHGNITQMDHSFGLLMKAIDEMGYKENTCIFYTSDNGPEGNGRSGRTRGSTGGLRGRKRHDYEGGIRVPGMVRFPAYFKKQGIKPGSVSDVPIVGQDIFSTICDLVEIPLPTDRTIDGASILPALEGKPVKREQPLYWRTHIAPMECRVALRIDDWKIVANENLTKFQLFNMKDDWKETTNIASKYPEKFEELKQILIKHDAAVKEEGPDWWKREPPRRSKKKQKTGPLARGEDKTGKFNLVKGATVTAHELGFNLKSADEGLALHKLEKPITGKAKFKFQYQSTNSGTTRNAALAFGGEPTNNHLFKIGTAIGMGTHVAFQGGWGNVGSHGRHKAKFEPMGKFTAEVTVDLKKRTCEVQIGEKKFKAQLPPDIKQIKHYGYYVKGTSTSFSPIEIADAE